MGQKKAEEQKNLEICEEEKINPKETDESELLRQRKILNESKLLRRLAMKLPQDSAIRKAAEAGEPLFPDWEE